MHENNATTTKTRTICSRNRIRHEWMKQLAYLKMMRTTTTEAAATAKNDQQQNETQINTVNIFSVEQCHK